MFHPHMALTLESCEKLSLIPGKTTAIIATCQCSIDVMMRSVFSLLMRSDPKYLEHFIVCLNGPDSRCGDPSLQDKKQAFFEKLRGLKWQGRDMPITVIRAWSRVGHTQAMEMAIPWVHTEFYLIMHDDLIIRSIQWGEVGEAIFRDQKIAIICWPPLLCGGLVEHNYQDKKLIGFPHFNSVFMMCRKAVLTQVGARWYGYHVPVDFLLSEMVDTEEFYKHHDARNQIVIKPQAEDRYGVVSTDIGAWMYYMLGQAGYRFGLFHPDTVSHLIGFSWENDKEKMQKRLVSQRPTINALLKEMETKEPAYKVLYDEFAG